MRESPPADKKKAWARHFLGLLQESHPDYTLNTRARGTRAECLRQADDGLFHSQNTICRRGRYSHGFAVLLSPEFTKGPFLTNPFQAGGRFDSNYSVSHAFFRDLVVSRGDDSLPRAPHASHSWRIGTDDIVRKCTAAAEEHLPALYRSWFRAAAPELLALLETTAALAPGLAQMSGLAAPRFLDVSLLDLASRRSAWHDQPKATRYASLVHSKPELFAAQLPHLDAMASRLDALLRT